MSTLGAPAGGGASVSSWTWPDAPQGGHTGPAMGSALRSMDSDIIPSVIRARPRVRHPRPTAASRAGGMLNGDAVETVARPTTTKPSTTVSTMPTLAKSPKV